MPIAGLVVTLSEVDDLRAHALAVIAREPRFTLGDLQRGSRLPLVTDAQSLEEQQDLWAVLERTPGVIAMDLAFLDFEDVVDFGSSELPARRHRED